MIANYYLILWILYFVISIKCMEIVNFSRSFLRITSSCDEVDNSGQYIVGLFLNSIPDGQLVCADDVLSSLEISIKFELLQRMDLMILSFFITLDYAVNSTRNESGRSPPYELYNRLDCCFRSSGNVKMRAYSESTDF